ncbi:MAG: glycosyltransferase [Balneolales bacterium]
MKVGLFFGTFAGGGAERMMINLAKGLHGSGVEVIVYVVNRTGVLLKEVPSYIQVHDYKAKHGAKSIIHKIRDTLKFDELDALISTQEHINASVALASIGVKTKTKIIFREANTPKQKNITAWRKYLNKKLYYTADHYVAVSKGVKDSMKDFYQLKEEKISVIYNPVVDGSLQTLAKEVVDDHPWFTERNDIPVIVAMGRFEPHKGFEDLIESFALVRNQREAKLVIFGDKNKNTRYFKSLQDKVVDLKLKDDVDFPGFVNNPYKYLAKASLFVLSSRYEGLPGVLIQAMACGCPVVSTDCPSGPEEILSNPEYGKLVPVSDPEKLSIAILSSLTQNHDINRITSRAAEFSVDKAVSAYLKLTAMIDKAKHYSI